MRSAPVNKKPRARDNRREAYIDYSLFDRETNDADCNTSRPRGKYPGFCPIPHGLQIMSANIQAVPTPPLALPANLSWLAAHNQFIVCVIVPKDGHPGKTNKLPINPRTIAYPSSGKDPTNWLSCDDAYTKANELNRLGGLAFGVGFWLTDDLNIWCLDIDQGLGADNQWLPAVSDLFAQLPGVAWELSHSRRGLHGWGRCAAPIAEHENRHDDSERGLHLELYSRGHFMMLGTASGGETVSTATLPAVLSPLFPAISAEDAAALRAEWSDEPHSMWHGPTDDDALIDIALKSKSKIGTLFPKLGKATFKQLWQADEKALAKHFPGPNGYDSSQADQAIACHLAFWTGNNWARIAALMERSGLSRPKHERGDYMHRTIGKACGWQKNFFNDGKGVKPGDAVPESAVSENEISLTDFYAYLPKHQYIFAPTRDLWSPEGLDASSLLWPNGNPPSEWLDRARPIHQMTWAPGNPEVIADKLVENGGWLPKKGANTFNLYRPPLIVPGGDPAKAQPWIDLVHYIYPNDAEHLIKWFAHRRQRPGQKVNHGIVLGGTPGIGKDTIVEPVKHGVGTWNCSEIAPKNLLDDFDGWKKSVLLIVSEARDMGDVTRRALYEHTKTLLVTPPNVLRCNEKYLREHAVFNVIGVIVTTNYPDSLHLPAEDRRHYVAWSDRNKDRDYQPNYWNEMYAWYEREGHAHVIAYLDSVDLSGFDPKAPPPLTPAFWIMVNSSRSSEDSTMADILEALGSPAAVTAEQVSIQAAKTNGEFCAWLRDSRNSRSIPAKFAGAGYVPMLNPDTKDKQWKVAGRRQSIYVRQELNERGRLDAATALSKPPRAAG